MKRRKGNGPPRSRLAVERQRLGRGGVVDRPASHNAARSRGRDVAEDETGERPVGPAPRGLSADLRRLWREASEDWPQLSRRDRQGLLSYCRVMQDAAELRAAVEQYGRFVPPVYGDDGECVSGGWLTAPYQALLATEKHLHTMRKDFAALAAHRSKADAISPPADRQEPEASRPMGTITALRAVPTGPFAPTGD